MIIIITFSLPSLVKSMRIHWTGIGEKHFLFYFICITNHRTASALQFTRRNQLQPLTGDWSNINMSSYQYRKSLCGDKTILRPSYLHNGISHTGETTSLYWIRALIFYRLISHLRVCSHLRLCFLFFLSCLIHDSKDQFHSRCKSFNYKDRLQADRYIFVLIKMVNEKVPAWHLNK